MPFSTFYTTAEIAYIASATLDDHNKNKPLDSAMYNKPTLKTLEGKAKTYGAIKEFHDEAVKGTHGNAGTNDSLAGVGPASTLGFYNPQNALRAKMAHRKMHIGITCSEDELERNGIGIDDGFKRPTRNMSDLDPRLFNIFQDKADDLTERAAESLNRLLWGDGVADVDAMAGILSIIRDNPRTGTVLGIDAAANSWWRNRAYTAAHGAAGGTGAITSSTASGGALLKVLNDDDRQLGVYGPKPDLFPCGSDFLSAAETEWRANGQTSQNAFAGGGDVTVGTLAVGNVQLYYEPELDLIGRAKYGYRLSTQRMCLMHQEGMWGKIRNPARPFNQLVYHKSMLYSGNLMARQLNNQAVYQIT